MNTYEIVTEKIISLLEQGNESLAGFHDRMTDEWSRCGKRLSWEGDRPASMRCKNVASC
jgi:hypothetical protein